VSGQGRHLTPTGATPPDAYYTGRTGTVHLSRHDDHAYTRPHEPALSPAEISFGLWLRLDPGAFPATIIGKMGVPDYAYAIALHEHTTDQAAFRFYHSPDGSSLNYNQVTTPDRTGWHHLVA